ncbi:MAG: GAF domain-containing protein [Patescibacteria group bacterium]|nr:GAF domain-containing protein [Patescibacteria group bacterium]MDE2588522.1 GAF domain-containing protein [Patescibacteria group bacterium]
MLLEIVLTIITLVLSTLLGLFIFYRNSHSWTNRFFFLLTLLLDCYLVVNYVSLHPPGRDPSIQLFWIRMVMFVCSFIGPTLLLLVSTFPGNKIVLRRKFAIPLLLLCIVSASASLSPLVFSSLQFPHGNPVPVPGPAIPVFFFDFVGLFITSIVLVIVKYKRSSGIIKTQFFYFLLGILLTFSTMGVSTVIFVVILQRSDFVFLGPISALFLLGCIAYAIVKHRFLDSNFIVARSVAYILLLLALGGFYSIAFLAIGSKILGIKFTPTEYLFFGLLMFVVSFSFSRIQGILEFTTDKFLYKGFYDAQGLLKLLSTIMSTNIALSNITGKILDAVVKSLRVTRGVYVLLGSKNKGKIEFIFNKGYDRVPDFTVSQVETFLTAKKTCIFDDLEEGGLKKLMREHQLAVVLPLIVNDEHIGILGLGEKQSGDTYSDQDIKVLEILAPQLAVAIQNSQEFEEIKRFNITLKEEVNSATKELREANEQLKQLDKMKDEFVSLASHELKTPMASIKSYLWFILFGGEKIGTLNEKQKMYADRAYNAVERLIKLVTDMLNMSRLEGGRIKLTVSSVDLMQLVKDVVTEIAGNAQTRGVTVEIIPFEGDLPEVAADADRVKEVVINLIGNSIKFTPAGGKVTVLFEKTGEFIKTSVIDTGKGITPEQMPMLFQKFGLIEGNYLTRAAVVEGTGLGLYLSKSLIELHGGKMEVSSEGENKGATFTFTLPVFKQGTVVQNLQSQQPTVSQMPVVASV